VPDSGIVIGYPLVFHFAQRLLGAFGVSGPGQIPLGAAYLHPTAIAAWVGMFATALNLLPGGQLDGGHIVYAVSPRLHKHVSRLTVGILLPMGFLLWAGWLIWALLLTISGVRHPLVPAWPGLRTNRKLLALLALLMLILTFVPEPFNGAALR
jgi:membrane-associated protease RseP (regulator of RpoE activity)